MVLGSVLDRGTHAAGPSQQQPQAEGAAVGLDAKLQVLSEIFELASLQTQIDHPLCLDCEVSLKAEIEAQVGVRPSQGKPCQLLLSGPIERDS